MGASKTSQFNEQTIHLATIARALAHPARITIVEHLLKHQCIMQKEIASIVQLSPVTVHDHISKLKDANLLDFHFVHNQNMVSLKLYNISILTNFLPQSYSNT
ncbi:MAG: ArsR family transcriptional regulator [Crocinitomicaceae bacterium]|nr:MAG: ArsR family transcriptional regulator [Crocinitomicaceae bacterium]